MTIRVDTITETFFTCDVPGCSEPIISTWVPLAAAMDDIEERGWSAFPSQFCPMHAGVEK